MYSEMNFSFLFFNDTDLCEFIKLLNGRVFVKSISGKDQ